MTPLELNPSLYPSDSPVRMYVKLIKVLYNNAHVFLNIEPCHTEEQQWKTLLFLDSRWLLYNQPIMSEGNTFHTRIRATLDVFRNKFRLSK